MNIDDLEGLDEETRQQIIKWQKVTREKDGGKAFAEAQLEIYFMTNEIKIYDSSLEVLNNIKYEDDEFDYQFAQMFLCILYFYHKKDIDSAFKSLSNFKFEDSETKSFLSYKIAEKFLNRLKNEEDIVNARRLLADCANSHSYESYCYTEICNLLENNDFIGKKILDLLKIVIYILNDLKIEFNGLTSQQKAPERKLAHYTSTYVASVLLYEDYSKNSDNSLRLNTISNVNDPSEGELLSIVLNKEESIIYSAPGFDEQLHAFISCFTFNHDSLNQFRLYGKQDNKEASGVSLVFNKNFFQSKTESEGLSFLSKKGLNKKFIEDANNKAEVDESLNQNGCIEKQSVMRCIYLDPNSGYIQLAQRNRLTFYREFGCEENSKQEWEKYKKAMDDKTEQVDASLKKIRNIYQSIKSNYPDYFKENLEFINKILLPLKYLIKHSAFQEEQECRMIYVTSLNDPKVKMVYGEALYVEYEANVKGNLDKIYIAPAATQYQPYLAKLLCDTNIKIELSNNPYRQT